MIGLMQVYARTGDARYADFVARWAGTHLPRGVERLLGNHPESERKGYCGPWISATALLYLYDSRKCAGCLQTASEIAAFLRAGATRSPEGALGHWLGNFQLWVDTLAMSCPLLARLARVENTPAYFDDAVNQLLVAARRLRNENTGLFHHMWDWQHDRRSPEQWGRGSGWVALAVADTLEFLPRGGPRYGELRSVVEAFAQSLVRAQDDGGVWHTIINDPATPAECSATTMISYGLLKLARLGVIGEKYRRAVLRGWAAANARWVKGGMVTGVSQGTGPYTRDKYLDREMGTFPWGTGAYLMAGAEAERLRGGRR